jgi:hypothetical protein
MSKACDRVRQEPVICRIPADELRCLQVASLLLLQLQLLLELLLELLLLLLSSELLLLLLWLIGQPTAAWSEHQAACCTAASDACRAGSAGCSFAQRLIRGCGGHRWGAATDGGGWVDEGASRVIQLQQQQQQRQRQQGVVSRISFDSAGCRVAAVHCNALSTLQALLAGTTCFYPPKVAFVYLTSFRMVVQWWLQGHAYADRCM